MPNTEGSGKDPVIAMVAVKLPIWFGDYAAAEDAAHARGLAYEADAEAAAAQSAAKVRRALADIRESARRAALYRDTLIPQAEAVYGSVLGSYEVGRSGTAAILLAQRDLIELRLTLANQAAMHERAWAALQATVGRPVKSEKADD